MLRLFEVETNDHDRALGSYDTSKLFDDFRFVSDVYCLKHDDNFSNNDVINMSKFHAYAIDYCDIHGERLVWTVKCLDF